MISVVIPALNEENAIAETVERVRATLEGAELKPYDILVVDDGSSDRTGELARKAGARVLRHPHNVGYGRSLKDGIAAAEYDMVAITDADGSYPVEKIPVLVDLYRQGFDMVVAARTGPHYRESALKSPLRWILKQIVEFTASREIPDINSGLRVFSKSTAVRFFDHLSNAFSFTTSMTLAYMMNSKFVNYVDTEYNKRIGRSKVRLLRDSLRTFQYILEAATYYNPLKIFALLAILGIVVSTITLIGAIALQALSLFILGVGGLLISVLIFSMGLLAVLLKQIMGQP